jgi:aspartate racemase
MRRLGLIGGSSWVSTIEYYRYINLFVNERLGGMEFAKLTIDSINFGDLIRCNETEDWPAVDRMLIGCATRLKAAEAQGLVICANTLHLNAQAIHDAVGLPIIHIADATAQAIKARGLNSVAVLGTRWTMEKDVYCSSLKASGIEMLIPDEEDRTYIHRSIFEELGKNVFKPETRAEYQRIIGEMASRGAQGAVLGCTEIPLLLSEKDASIPLFDTTKIHAAAAVDFYLSDGS